MKKHKKNKPTDKIFLDGVTVSDQGKTFKLPAGMTGPKFQCWLDKNKKEVTDKLKFVQLALIF